MKYTIALIISIFSILNLQVSAEVQKLCIKKKLRIVNNRIKHSKALLLISDGTCPRGTKELLNTSIFKGADGKNGANGLNGKDGESGINGLSPLINLYTNSSNSNFTTFSSRITHIYSGSNFVKSSKTSIVKISISGSLRLTNDTAVGAGFNLQIRMNNSDSAGSNNDSFNKGISGSFSMQDPSLAANANIVLPFNINGIFTNLDATSIIPSLWANPVGAQQLTINPASAGQIVITIEEVEL